MVFVCFSIVGVLGNARGGGGKLGEGVGQCTKTICVCGKVGNRKKEKKKKVRVLKHRFCIVTYYLFAESGVGRGNEYKNGQLQNGGCTNNINKNKTVKFLLCCALSKKKKKLSSICQQKE